MISKQYRGSSLIEVLIALLVVSFSIGGIVTLHTNMSYMSNLAGDKRQALDFAESELEKARLKAFVPGSGAVNLFRMPDKFTMNSIVTEHPASPDLKSVEITVSWKDNRQVNRSVSLRTMLYFSPE